VRTAKIDITEVPYSERKEAIFSVQTKVLAWVTATYSKYTSTTPQIVTKGESVGVNLHGREVAMMRVDETKIDLRLRTPESESSLPCIL